MTADLPAVVIQAAHDHYARYGIDFPVPGWTIGPDVVFGPRKIDAMATPELIWFSATAARDVTNLGRVALTPRRLRMRAWLRCVGCEHAALLVLHEAAHEGQMHADPSMLDGPYDTPRVEGYAEAVAIDLYPVFVRRLLGRPPSCLWVRPDAPPGVSLAALATRVCPKPEPVEQYRTYVDRARAASAAATGGPWSAPAAKWWRFKQLFTPGATGVTT